MGGQPRSACASPYSRPSDEEIQSLYPPHLELKVVQAIFRHGERAPVRVRLENAGIPRHFNLCSHAQQFAALVRGMPGQGWARFPYARQVEEVDSSGAASQIAHESSTCLLGELTDKGRTTTYLLGKKLRELYCDRLGFMPSITTVDQLYLRASPMPRALESLQQVVHGYYPPQYLPDSSILSILQRNFTEENLFPNEGACKKLRLLSEEYAAKAALKWNPILAGRTSDIFAKYIEPPIKIDGTPRLSGLMDTINAARGNDLPVPIELLDSEMLEEMHSAVVEEWFGGYLHNMTYRRLGAGRLLGDLRDRMNMTISSRSPVKVALYGAHDTTLGSLLATLADSNFVVHWPPFTSHLVLETFAERQPDKLAWLRGAKHYVRIKYNDVVVPVRGCKDMYMCTLSEFNKIVDDLVPEDWQKECQQA